MWPRLSAAGLLLLLAACASTGQRFEKPSSWQRFALESRLAIHLERPDESPQNASGTLDWQHEHQRDLILIRSPFGHILARLDRQPGGVHLKLANGREFQADSLQALSAQSLGYTLPFDDLPDWLEGRGSPAMRLTRDAAGRPSELHDGPWQVRYTYPDAAADSLPSRLDLHSTDGLTLKLQVEHWTTGPEWLWSDTP